jgi:hypothetical protein
MKQQEDKKMEASSSSLTSMQRAEDLLRKMTIKEKVMQLSCVYPMGLLGAEAPSEASLIPSWGKASVTSLG